MARFNTADPYRGRGGAASPSSWNRYSYVHGDPVNYFWWDHVRAGSLFSHGQRSCRMKVTLRMPATYFEERLDRAATLFGIGAAYHDIWGREHFTTAQTKEAI